MAMAAGASTVDVPVSGCSGGIAHERRPVLLERRVAGHSTFMSSVAPTKETTTTTAPRRMVRNFIAGPGHDEIQAACRYFTRP